MQDHPYRKELLDRAMSFYDRLFDLTRTVVVLNLAVGVLSSFLFGQNGIDDWSGFTKGIIFLAIVFFGVVFNLGAWCAHSFLYLTIRRILREVREIEVKDEAKLIPRFTRLIDADSLYRDAEWSDRPRYSQLRRSGVGMLRAGFCILSYEISFRAQDAQRASDEVVQMLHDHAFLFEKVFFLVCVVIWGLIACAVLFG